MTPAQRIREALTEVDDTLDRKGGVAPIIRLATWNKVKEAISALDTIEEESRWIPVGDRLPEIVQRENDWQFSAEVLGCAPLREDEGSWQEKICYYRIDPEGHIYWTALRPTHWMPLPPPPKV